MGMAVAKMLLIAYAFLIGLNPLGWPDLHEFSFEGEGKVRGTMNTMNTMMNTKGKSIQTHTNTFPVTLAGPNHPPNRIINKKDTRVES